MKTLPEMLNETAAFLRGKISHEPKIGIILGTGLGKLAGEISDATPVSYEEIPNFVRSTVEGHAGRLIFGKLSGKNVVAMQGRFHFYEGYSMAEITFPVRVMKKLGVEVLIVSNAAGGLNPQYRPGDIMIIADHINLLNGNPLIGKNYSELGHRFPDMSEPYSREWIAKAENAALDEKIPVKKGVYAAMSGPCLETAAEYRMLRVIGADAIGMSTVPEVIVGVHGNMKILGLSVITDACFPDSLRPVDIKEIIAIADKAEPKLVKLIKKVIS